MAEQVIEANGVELCAESFGDPADPPVLLVMGTGASMQGFCRMLADGGRFVVRHDHRDTGRSVSYEPGRPGYGGEDLVADAAGVLDRVRHRRGARRRCLGRVRARAAARARLPRARPLAHAHQHLDRGLQRSRPPAVDG